MTTTYRTHGNLTGSVTDLAAARRYLREDDMTPFIWDTISAKPAVHSINWDLTSDHTWEVIMVTERELTAGELAAMSSWVSGQNSDGLGESFEQQPFAEVGGDPYDEEDEEDFSMVSFDWKDNDCAFVKVR